MINFSRPIRRMALSALTVSTLFLGVNAGAQTPGAFNYMVRFSMQGYNLPFKNIFDNFKNPGISFGVEYRYNKPGTILQSLNVGWLNHAEHGNSLYVSTQFNYRPNIRRFQPGIGLGVGRVINFNNANPLYAQLNGKWAKSNKQSESRWITPLTVDLGYQVNPKSHYSITPFIGYEISPTINYNNAFPVLPTTLLTIGSRLNIQRK